ncbi:MAG: DegQ family serine endoprotease [Halieaceae bacterium]|nr:DegQ family serine endoprotease [Halieaceae bacterium]MCP5205050.1 DegQ family serine endoprotease [Pseudomonadales bacterium]
MNPVNRMLTSVAVACVLLAYSALSAASLPEFREIVKKNSPAVVKIIVEQDTSVAPGHPGTDEIPEYLRRFFEFRGAPPPQHHEQMGMGSGFVISEDGYIVTNNHVVEGASSVLVRLSDRREFDAEVIGTDPRSDLALLRIEASDLPVLKLGKDGELEVGEWVLAIGSPFGLDYSVTAGIVSAKGRSLPTERNENYVPFIQTDVAINPGNSGGPLFNLDGEVVGVNSQIFTRSGGSIGLSFAIPVSVVRNVVEQLKADGRVTRGWLGVTIQDVDKNLAESFGLDRPRGALVVEVAPGGPADDAGLQSGDIILSFDGTEIPTSAQLPHVVGLETPGTEVVVEVMRDRKRKEIDVEVGGLGAEDGFSLTASGTATGQGGRLGALVEEAPAELLERWGINGGVLVREVAPDSVAAEAGVLPGDVITLIGSTPIKSVASYADVEAGLPAGGSVPLRLIRRGSPLFIGLKLGD